MTSNSLTNCLFLTAVASSRQAAGWLVDDSKQTRICRRKFMSSRSKPFPSSLFWRRAGCTWMHSRCLSVSCHCTQLVSALFANSDFIYHVALASLSPYQLFVCYAPTRQLKHAPPPPLGTLTIFFNWHSFPANPHHLWETGWLWCGRTLWRWRSGFWAC